ncbi:oligosaccharyltransferase complex subunit epsilon [Xanthoria parietina]
MAPKRPTSSAPSTPSKPSTTSSSSSTTATTSTQNPQPSKTSLTSSSSTQSSSNNPQVILQQLWTSYQRRTPQRVKLIDVFMGFLVVVGVLQFAYCVLVGNYPFNAFLSGFSATVGQFVLTASLRIQTNPENKDEFKTVSHERAFADFVLGSLILHFFCVNFIN